MTAPRPAVVATVLASVFALPLEVIAGGPAAPHKQVTAWTPQDIRWFTPAYYTDGRQRARLYGDSSTHPDGEIVTVMEGTWYSFILIPAHVPHSLAVKEGPVIVQASSHGIFRTNFLERQRRRC